MMKRSTNSPCSLKPARSLVKTKPDKPGLARAPPFPVPLVDDSGATVAIWPAASVGCRLHTLPGGPGAAGQMYGLCCRATATGHSLTSATSPPSSCITSHLVVQHPRQRSISVTPAVFLSCCSVSVSIRPSGISSASSSLGSGSTRRRALSIPQLTKLHSNRSGIRQPPDPLCSTDRPAPTCARTEKVLVVSEPTQRNRSEA